VLAGGDDYELAFCAPFEARAAVQAAAEKSQTPVTRIGCTQAQTGLRLRQIDGTFLAQKSKSFDHFA
jgi:thiamine-monophosphate kinase